MRQTRIDKRDLQRRAEASARRRQERAPQAQLRYRAADPGNGAAELLDRIDALLGDHADSDDDTAQ